MRFRKITACLCALCVLGGTFPYYSNGFTSAVSSESTKASNEINFTAVGQFTTITITNSDETPTWYSDNTNVATVDTNGKVTAVGEGTANIYAVFSTQMLQFPVTVTVSPEQNEFDVGSITLSNDAPSAELSFEGIDLTSAVWTSSDESVAVVDSNGVVTAVGQGECTVSALVNDKKYNVSVSSSYIPPEQITEIVLGTLELSSEKPSAAISFSELPEGTVIIWSSSDTSVAAVDSNGVVTAAGSGTCRIIALIEGVSYITEVTSTYTPPEQITEVIIGSAELSNDAPSAVIKLSGLEEDTVVLWESSDTSVAVVSPLGEVTAVGSGSCDIIAIIEGVNYITKITSTYTPGEKPEIDAGSAEIVGIGKQLQLRMINADETPEWVSTNVNVASVDENGLVTAVGEGTAVILAKLSNQICSVTITVTAESVQHGDANCDGTVDVNDAVLIMSHMANKTKYPLSAEAINNGDVYQRGDGISLGDANSVQKYLAKLIKELPES